ncbi:MAG: hypothetical protein HFG37_07380 [Eubacterium sp.]|nr:hypothetical protein [Eubacterium sp.]
MNENIDSNAICEGTDSEINWACKICKNFPNYAGMFLNQCELKRDKVQNEKEQNADFIQMKYYYALLHLLDDIHMRPECPNPESVESEYKARKCPTPEHFNHYRNIYNIYANILMSEKGLNQVNLKCDICAVLPYTIFCDLDMVAKNMHSDEIEKTQKLELEAVISDYYLETVGSCERWNECSTGVDWLELLNSVQLLKKYLETKDRKELQISLNDWNRVRAFDNILNTGVKTTSRDFQTKDIPLCVLEKKTLVYMDFGVYQLYESNEVFHTQLDNYVKMDEIQFVYSPTHMEEACRMGNFTFEIKRRENVSKICSNCEVLPVQDGRLRILIEPVDVCFTRAKKLQTLNQYAEESECATFEVLEEKTCKLLRWDGKEAEKRRKEISSLTSTQLFDPNNETIDNESLNKVFYLICGSHDPIEDFKDYCKKERTFSEIRKVVRLFYILMNALGYHRNKIEKRTKFTYKAFYPTYDREFYRTIRSGFYDVDHICYASKCDYFVTCDCALLAQAREIYRFLGCKTCVIYCEKKTADPSLPLEVLCKKTATS